MARRFTESVSNGRGERIDFFEVLAQKHNADGTYTLVVAPGRDEKVQIKRVTGTAWRKPVRAALREHIGI